MSEMKDETKLCRVSDLYEKWGDAGYDEKKVSPFSWRPKAFPHLKDGNVEEMRKSALPSLQWKLLEVAHESKNEKNAIAAAALVMAQAGHGALQRVEHTMNYERLPEEQLTVMLKSKLEALQKLAPNMNVEKLLLSTPTIEAELVPADPVSIEEE